MKNIWIIIFAFWTLFGMNFYSGLSEEYRILSEHITAFIISLMFFNYKHKFKENKYYRWLINPLIYLWVFLTIFNLADSIYCIVVTDDFLRTLSILQFPEVFKCIPYLFITCLYILIVIIEKGNTLLKNNLS